MLAEHDILARAEQQERASAVRALRLALLETLVPDEGRLLVARESGDLHAFEHTAGAGAVHLGRGDDLREHGGLNLKEGREARVPLQRIEVHEQGSRGIRHVGDMEVLIRAACETLFSTRERSVISTE